MDLLIIIPPINPPSRIWIRSLAAIDHGPIAIIAHIPVETIAGIDLNPEPHVGIPAPRVRDVLPVIVARIVPFAKRPIGTAIGYALVTGLVADGVLGLAKLILRDPAATVVALEPGALG
jgi:hypothetical protein